MKPMSSAEVRQAFLDFFAEHKHRIIPSSSLVPGNDPTLLFTNAGMVQFKDAFLGLEKRDYTRAATAQKCMRVSGKHNDLEEVGLSPRHHTFFEMLGNFSFGGDYFKVDAMHFAYQLLTDVFGLPADRLAFTIYEKDDESFDLWVNEIGIDPRRIARLGPDSNFWQMAETGPCGPNTEIFWDFRPEEGVDTIIPALLEDSDRFVEIWNLVFMQFNRTQPDPEHTGQWDEPLPKPGVDTGMGLERITSVLQGVGSNFETDLFTPIIEATQKLTGHSDAQRDANLVPYRVIADHIRAAVFLIADGVLPGPKGRDSVARLVIRRAARFGRKIGLDKPFLAQVADAVIDVMGHHYTELVERREAIQRAITREEELFGQTMDRGIAELEAMLDELPEGGVLSGEQAFYLKATLGLPIQVTKDIAEERGYSVDMAGFEEAEAEHSRVSGGGQALGHLESADAYAEVFEALKREGKLSDEGVDYQPYGPTTLNAEVVAILREGQPAERVISGDKVEIILNRTPFYVESGGQVSDTGYIRGKGWTIQVEDMKKPLGGLIVHIGEVVEGTPLVGDEVSAEVDEERRADITRNHTGTHLLHAALRNRLGTHVQQRGSLVAPDRLRFDFAHDAKVTTEELDAIEEEVNQIIIANYPVKAEYKSLKEAQQEGAMALFGEKYGEIVRTISVGKNGERYSYELCGGVHVSETGEIGPFVIVSEGSVSAGIRRVEALTGRAAVHYMQEQFHRLHEAASQLGTTPDHVPQRVAILQDEIAQMRKHIGRLQRDLARYRFAEMVNSMEDVAGVKALIAQIDGLPAETLREMADWFRNKVDSGVMVLASVVDNSPLFIATVTQDLIKQGLHAGNLVREVAKVVKGGGGGRPDMAQAGGKDASKVPEALEKARQVIAEQRK